VPGPDDAALVLLCSLPIESSEWVRLRKFELVRGFAGGGPGMGREMRCYLVPCHRKGKDHISVRGNCNFLLYNMSSTHQLTHIRDVLLLSAAPLLPTVLVPLESLSGLLRPLLFAERPFKRLKNI
jgi:hypothetical protein